MPLIELAAETMTEVNVRLLPSLDMLKIKDKKDRGTVTLKVLFVSYDLTIELLSTNQGWVYIAISGGDFSH